MAEARRTALTAATRNDMLNKINDRINAGAAAGKCRLYTGAAPATPETAATGTLLADITLNDPAFEVAAAGSMALDVTPEPQDASADAAGTGGYARFMDSDLNGVIDVNVGDDTDADTHNLEFNTNIIEAGALVKIMGYTISLPANVTA